jgi:hypothetical protein
MKQVGGLRPKANIRRNLMIKSQEPVMKNNRPKNVLLFSKISVEYNPQSGL